MADQAGFIPLFSLKATPQMCVIVSSSEELYDFVQMNISLYAVSRLLVSTLL